MSRLSRSPAVVALASLLGLTSACDDQDPPSMDGGTSEIDDASGTAGDDADTDESADETGTSGGELPGTCPAGPAPAMNAQGVLTHYPSQSWFLGSPTLVPTSVNYVADRSLLSMYVEVRNDGPTECLLLPRVELDGAEVLGLITASAFEDGFSTVTTECIPPGGTGVFSGLIADFDEAVLETATVSFDPNPGPRFDLLPALEPLVVDRSVEMLDGDAIFTATVTPDRTIWNHKLSVFPRDEHGLVFGELLDFPNELGTLPGGSSWPLETLGVPCRFDDYHLYQSWIEGEASALIPDPDDARNERRRQHRRRQHQMDELRPRR